MTAASDLSVELATKLASRLCHDFAGSLGGILSGIELLGDPDSPVPREESLALVEQGAKALAVQLAFARIAFGGGEEPLAAEQLESLTRDLFADLRPELEWNVGPGHLPAPVARTLLNLAQLAVAALGVSGIVRCRADCDGRQWLLAVDAIGARARLYPEVAAGLGGEGRGDGLAGRWVQGALVYETVRVAGGEVRILCEEGAVRFNAILPTS